MVPPAASGGNPRHVDNQNRPRVRFQAMTTCIPPPPPPASSQNNPFFYQQVHAQTGIYQVAQKRYYNSAMRSFEPPQPLPQPQQYQSEPVPLAQAPPPPPQQQLPQQLPQQQPQQQPPQQPVQQQPVIPTPQYPVEAAGVVQQGQNYPMVPSNPGAMAPPPPGLDPSQMYIVSGPYMKFDSGSQTYLPVFTAKPVPSGATVIATPKIPSGVTAAPAAPSSSAPTTPPGTQTPPSPPAEMVAMQQHHHHQHHQLTPPCQSPVPNGAFNPNATPFFPKQGEEPAPSSPTPSPSSMSTTPSPPASIGSPPLALQHKHNTPHFMYWSAQHPEGTLIPLRQPQPPVYFQQPQTAMMAVEAN